MKIHRLEKACKSCGANEFIHEIATALEGAYNQCTYCGNKYYVPSTPDEIFREVERQSCIDYGDWWGHNNHSF